MKIFHYFMLGLGEYSRSFKLRDAWLYLGIQDIKLRYRRSILGPWWVTISTAIMILALGFLWSNIFVTDTKTYMPFFAVGYVFWTWISAQISDATTGFVQFENAIKQTNLPFPIYVFRLCVRNFIVLLHNLIIVFIVILLLGIGINRNVFFFFPAVLLIQFVLAMLCSTVSIFCTRYRDMSQVITVLLQIAFFFSPIIWEPKLLRTHRELIEFNPIFHWIEIIRQPLLGNIPPFDSWLFVLINAALFFLVSIYILGRYRNRISVWL
jgi:ABC-type polysaccharide/polyol phosphate export permease